MKTKHESFINGFEKMPLNVLLVFLFFAFTLIGISCERKDDVKTVITAIDMIEMA